MADVGQEIPISQVTKCTIDETKQLIYRTPANSTLMQILTHTSALLRHLAMMLILFFTGMSRISALPYRVLTTADGLSSSLVTYIFQDSYGMIWIATEDGLNRYDGVKIVTYRNRKDDETSLQNNYVRAVREDSKGNVIVCTYNGVQIYRRATDDFSPEAKLPTGEPVRASITDLVTADAGSVYGTGDMLCKVAVESGKEHATIMPVDWDTPHRMVGEMLAGDNKDIWFRYNKQMYNVSLKDGKAKMLQMPTGKEDATCSFLGDGLGQAYCACSDMLYRVTVNGLHPIGSVEAAKSVSVRSIARFDDTHLLIGTDGRGIALVDEHTGKVSPFPLDIPGIDASRLKVHRILRDREGNLWLGLYQKGVVMISTRKSAFRYIGPKTSSNDLIGKSAVLSLCRSRQGGMWVGTDGDGLYYVDREKGTSTHYGMDIVPPMINAVYEDSHGSLWIGSYSSACCRRKAGQSHFEKMEGIKIQTGTSSRVFDITEDDEGHVWLATMGNGLQCYDMAKEQFVEIETDGINPWQNCVLADSEGHLLIGTFNGIYAIGKKKNIHLCDRSIIFCLYEDKHNHVWAGTTEGLLLLDISKGTKRLFTTNDGLPSNAVYSITGDDDGQLWIATNAGLSCLETNLTTFINYSQGDGLQGNEFSKDAVAKETNGTLWFAGHDGMTLFMPKECKREIRKLHARVTSIYINNVAVSSKTQTGGRPVMEGYIGETEKVSFSHDCNSFSIELATTEMDVPENVEYSYALDDGEWTSLPLGTHLVSFSRLSPGNYLFRYRIRCNGWTSPEKTMAIEVREPWWATAWAKIFYCLLFFSFITILFFWLRAKEKIKILALISHKIRTPMSLIISPLIQMIDKETDEERKTKLELMLRNAYRLQNLAAIATREQPIGPIEINPTEVEAAVPKNETDETSNETANGREQNGSEANIQKSRTSMKLLIAEDDAEMRSYLQQELSADFHIFTATNGKEALQLIFNIHPDAILSDITMPEMDGITLCNKVKKNINLSHIPVLLLTARADEKSNLQGLGTGADAYITKPFNIKILRQKILNLIALRLQLRNVFQGKQLQEHHLEKVETEDFEAKMMERIMEVINLHISDADFTIEELCNEVGISRAQLHRNLKKTTNQSASIFIRNVRLKQAEHLLAETNCRVSEIATRVGFKQVTYFINLFKELYGMSPTQWRKTKKMDNQRQN